VRGLLLLGVVGAILYGLLLLTDKVVPQGTTGNTVAQANPPAARALRSWGRTLPALVVQSPSDDRPRHSEQQPVADDRLDVSVEKLAEANVVAVKVVLAARMHSEPFVSSPTVRFYTPGTELHLVRRHNGWVELIDPVTRQRGWVLESNVFSIEDRAPAQTAMGSPSGDELSKPKASTPILRSKRQGQTAKSVPRVAAKFAAKSELRRGGWARGDERRRRSGLFGRRFATFDNSW